MPPTAEFPIIFFETAKKWELWLAKNFAQSNGIWMRIGKKDSGTKSVTYAEALDVALCYGWIDGQKQTYDDSMWLQKFTPRRSKSGWSKINTQHAERLMKSGKMQPPGLKQINAAKEDGRWKQAYDSGSNAVLPEDFLQKLQKDKKALAFYQSLNKANTYAIIYRLQTAKKPETRKKRMELILAMLKRGEKFHT